MDTQPSSAHLASLAQCFVSSATKAADPAVTLASGKMLETSGDVTVKSKAAGLPSIQFVARTSAGRLRRSSDPYLPPTVPPPACMDHQCRLSGKTPQKRHEACYYNVMHLHAYKLKHGDPWDPKNELGSMDSC